MRHTQLKALGHNLAYSLASGMGFMIGTYQTNVFAEAATEHPGYLEVDFLNATVIGGPASQGLRRAITLYRDQALPELCKAHAVSPATIRTLRVRYSVHTVTGPEFTVTVENSRGRQSVESYAGLTGERIFRRRTAHL